MINTERLVFVVAGVIAGALLADRLDERLAAPPEAAVALPAQWPACPRLRPLAGRIDTIVIDHVLIYRCART